MFLQPPEELDIVQHLNEAIKSVDKLYYCPQDFPPPFKQGEFSECPGWINLQRKLEKSVLEDGNPVICNGG